MSKYSYGWEKLHGAMHSLSGQGSQSQRLVSAVAFNLIRIDPEKDIPHEIKDEFKSLMHELTSVNAVADEGKIEASVASMGEVEISRAVEKIIGFYDATCRHCEPF